MPRVRRQSASTRALRERAWRNEQSVVDALFEGRRLSVSNRTDVDHGTVHHSLALKLVKRGRASYDHLPNGATDLTARSTS